MDSRSLTKSFQGSLNRSQETFEYSDDYRDPEPPPLNEALLKRIFCHSEKLYSDEMSLIGVASGTQVKDGVDKVTKGYYRGVTSVHEAINRRQHLLKSIPPTLSVRQLNKLTLPPCEHLLLELKEDGYNFAKDILEKLMKLDDQIIEVYEKKEEKKLERPPLRDNRYYLITLTEAFKLVEQYKKHGRKTETYSLFMYLGEFFKNLHESWKWLAYEMYKLAIDTIQGYRVDLGFGEALARYILGKFCYYEMKDEEEALEHFEIAHKLSINRTWNTVSLGGSKEEDIHSESTYLHHRVALDLAHTLVDTQPKRATELGFTALKRVTECGKHPEIEEAQRSLAYLYEKSKQPLIALTVLMKQIKQSTENQDYRGVALGYFLQSHCYKVMRKYEKACQCLQIMIDTATNYNEKDLEALGCKSLGEYYFSIDSFKLADQLLSRSVKKYVEVGQLSAAARVSVHAGAVKAADNMWLMSQIIIASASPEEAMYLIQWFLTEDPQVWNLLKLRLPSYINLQRGSKMIGDNLAKLEMPHNSRVNNALLNRSEIQIVESDASDSD